MDGLNLYYLSYYSKITHRYIIFNTDSTIDFSVGNV